MATHKLSTVKLETLHLGSPDHTVATVKMEALVRDAPGDTYEATLSQTMTMSHTQSDQMTYNEVVALTVNFYELAHYGVIYDTLTQTVSFTDYSKFAIPGLVEEYVNILQAETVSTPKPAAVSETINMTPTEVVLRLRIGLISEIIRASYRIAAAKRKSVAETDGVDVTPALAYEFRPGALIHDVSSIALAQAPSTTFNLSLAEAIDLADTLGAPFSKVLADTINITAANGFVQAAVMLETIQTGLTEIASSRKYLTLSQSLSLADSLARFVDAVLSDGVDVTPALTRMFRAVVTEAQTVTVAPVAAATVSMVTTVAEGVDIDDTDLVKLAYAAIASDTVNLGISYISPNGNFTAWAVNTMTAAVTEYSNFEFNSFARNGHHYAAGNSAGLYELTGDDDAGTNITGLIRSGLLSLNGTRFSRFKAVYLGTSGGGEYVLKLIAGDSDETTTYQVLSNAVQTSKVWVGKGLRARYWQFELSNASGQDFDLESIEFVPLMVGRRV